MRPTALVVGASGKTGQLLVQQLLDRDWNVLALVRVAAKMPVLLYNNPHIQIVEANVLDMPDEQLQEYCRSCSAVVSCLGHAVSWQGIFGAPHTLVSESVQKLCRAVAKNAPPHPIRFVLMNSAGNRLAQEDHPLRLDQKAMIGLIRQLPPHADNEQAAQYLVHAITKDHAYVQWVVVRPNALIDALEPTPYDVRATPRHATIFNAARTSRINVAHFMAELVDNASLWRQWVGKMPVVENRTLVPVEVAPPTRSLATPSLV